MFWLQSNPIIQKTTELPFVKDQEHVRYINFDELAKTINTRKSWSTEWSYQLNQRKIDINKENNFN